MPDQAQEQVIGTFSFCPTLKEGVWVSPVHYLARVSISVFHLHLLPSLSEMGTVQGKRTVFSTCLCIGGQQWPTQSQPRHFQSGAQTQPCCLHPSGAPTHLPLSRPFCCCRTYLVKSFQEVTSQEESFIPDISGYIWERVKSSIRYSVLPRTIVLEESGVATYYKVFKSSDLTYY